MVDVYIDKRLDVLELELKSVILLIIRETHAANPDLLP